MYNFFESGIRGEMTFVNKHTVAAGKSTFLLYIDINNLYEWALRQKLPYGDFRWIKNGYEQILQDCLTKDLHDLDYGYQLEVDFFIPDALHDALDDLPLFACSHKGLLVLRQDLKPLNILKLHTEMSVEIPSLEIIFIK